MSCIHCNQRPASRPRGLCWNCYYNAGIRRAYPPVYDSDVDFTGMSRPTTPIPFPRWSQEWYEAMHQRVLRREVLHHPEDAR